jgi:hypothetical protein
LVLKRRDDSPSEVCPGAEKSSQTRTESSLDLSNGRSSITVSASARSVTAVVSARNVVVVATRRGLCGESATGRVHSLQRPNFADIDLSTASLTCGARSSWYRCKRGTYFASARSLSNLSQTGGSIALFVSPFEANKLSGTIRTIRSRNNRMNKHGMIHDTPTPITT